MDLQRFGLGCVLLVAAFSVGCQPKIGDSCRQHTDCSTAGTRICEPNFPGGYCTIFNCEPNSCPSEAVCVAYQSVTSTKPACANALDQRLERTFCMRGCSSDGDCRGGYACVDISQSNAWGAVIVDAGSHATKICTIPLSPAAEQPTPDSTEVCSPPLDASFPPVSDGAAPVSDAGSSDASMLRSDAAVSDGKVGP